MKKPNYYKEAASETLNIIMLISLAVTAVAGYQFIALPLLLIELIYMIVLPNMSGYKKYTNLKKGWHDETGSLEKNYQQKLLDLPYEIRGRAEKLENKYKDVLKMAGKSPDLKTMMAKELQQLEFLLENYINFLLTLSHYKEYILNNNLEIINDEMNNIRHRIKTCFDNLKDNNDLDLIHKRMQKKTLLHNNLSILQKRSEKIKQIRGAIDTLQVEIDVIEDTFYLISDHIATFTPGDSLNLDLNSIVNSVENTEKIVKETRSEMDKLKNLSIQKILE